MRSQRAAGTARTWRRSRGTTPTEPQAELGPLLVLFDAECTRCRRVAAWLASRDNASSLTLRPLQDGGVLEAHGISPTDAKAAVHVVAGTSGAHHVASGGAALLMVAGTLAGLRWTRRFADARAARAIGDAAYWLLSRRRDGPDCC